MSARTPFLDKDAVQTGKPLPFSIYGADGALLLAQGQVVESDRMRELLRETGMSCSRNSADNQSAAAALKNEEERICPILKLSRDYVKTVRRSMAGLKMSRDEAQEGYTTWVIGMNQQCKSLILTQPTRADKSLVPVLEGDQWTFRTFHATSVFRFNSAILKVSFEPFPHLHVAMPKLVDQKSVRKCPRASVALLSKITAAGKEGRCFVADLSALGARIAVPSDLKLAKGDAVNVAFNIKLVDREFPVSLNSVVASAYGESDAQHPRVCFYGLSFENISERDMLVLHGCVQEKLASELDSLWQALSIPT